MVTPRKGAWNATANRFDGASIGEDIKGVIGIGCMAFRLRDPGRNGLRLERAAAGDGGGEKEKKIKKPTTKGHRIL